jgi:hypothetical protein
MANHLARAPHSEPGSLFNHRVTSEPMRPLYPNLIRPSAGRIPVPSVGEPDSRVFDLARAPLSEPGSLFNQVREFPSRRTA